MPFFLPISLVRCMICINTVKGMEPNRKLLLITFFSKQRTAAQTLKKVPQLDCNNLHSPLRLRKVYGNNSAGPFLARLKAYVEEIKIFSSNCPNCRNMSIFEKNAGKINADTKNMAAPQETGTFFTSSEGDSENSPFAFKERKKVRSQI